MLLYKTIGLGAECCGSSIKSVASGPDQHWQGWQFSVQRIDHDHCDVICQLCSINKLTKLHVICQEMLVNTAGVTTFLGSTGPKYLIGLWPPGNLRFNPGLIFSEFSWYWSNNFIGFH